MPVNPYDDRKVSLWRPHGNGDLDTVRASYTRRKANVTEALANSADPDQGSYRQICVKFKNFSRTSQYFLTVFKD